LEAQFIKNNLNTSLHEENTASNYCPFLINNNCSIYNFRPFACRTLHAAYNPKYCETNQNIFYGKNLGRGDGIYEDIGLYFNSQSIN